MHGMNPSDVATLHAVGIDTITDLTLIAPERVIDLRIKYGLGRICDYIAIATLLVQMCSYV
jgi:hypothetical protein